MTTNLTSNLWRRGQQFGGLVEISTLQWYIIKEGSFISR